jgi:signal transduction histidine kinase
VTRDVEAATIGARRALAALGHDLASPLTALYTFLQLAKGEGLGPIRRCADRIQAIAELARELAELEDDAPGAVTNLVLAIESAAARLAIAVQLDVTGEPHARIAMARAGTCATALLRAVADTAAGAPITARVARRADRICARIDPGIEPSAWRVVDPWSSGTGSKLDLWAAAVAAGEHGIVRVGELNGQIAVELELPVPS